MAYIAPFSSRRIVYVLKDGIPLDVILGWQSRIAPLSPCCENDQVGKAGDPIDSPAFKFLQLPFSRVAAFMAASHLEAGW